MMERQRGQEIREVDENSRANKKRRIQRKEEGKECLI